MERAKESQNDNQSHNDPPPFPTHDESITESGLEVSRNDDTFPGDDSMSISTSSTITATSVKGPTIVSSGLKSVFPGLHENTPTTPMGSDSNSSLHTTDDDEDEADLSRSNSTSKTPTLHPSPPRSVSSGTIKNMTTSNTNIKASSSSTFNKTPPSAHSLHPNIVARAATDSTLAVIPAAAFRKLTEKFPNAAAHIVQVILTRFQRVTFLTLYKYLGMSKELLKIEKRVNEFAGYGLPHEFFEPVRVLFLGSLVGIYLFIGFFSSFRLHRVVLRA
jgi:hypothetical protein